MKTKSSVLAAVGMVLAAIAGNAQGKPLAVAVCALVRSPVEYDKKLETVRGRVSLAFEDFSLLLDECRPTDKTWIWLAFGGDIETPTIYCCGDHSRKRGSVLEVEGIQWPVIKDSTLETFLAMLKKHGRDKSRRLIDVTITGRYFAGEARTFPNGKVYYGGYGHLGFSSLLVIQQVVDARAVR